MPTETVDPFTSAIDKAVAATKPRSRCSVAKLAASLSPEEAATLNRHLARPTDDLPHVAISVAVADLYKVDLPAMSIGRHRRHVCGCGK